MFKSCKTKNTRTRVDSHAPSSSHRAHSSPAGDDQPSHYNDCAEEYEDPMPRLMPGKWSLIPGVAVPAGLTDLKVKEEQQEETKRSKAFARMGLRPSKSKTNQDISKLNWMLEGLSEYQPMPIQIRSDKVPAEKFLKSVNSDAAIGKYIKDAKAAAKSATQLISKVHDAETRRNLEDAVRICNKLAKELQEQLDQIIKDARLAYFHDIESIERLDYLITYKLKRK